MILGLGLGLGASICWALANVAVQRSARAVGVVRALVWAQIAGGLVMAVLAPAFDRPSVSWTPDLVAWAAVGGVAACLAYFGLFLATAEGRLSVVVPIASSWALLSTAIGVGILGEPLRAMNVAGACLVVLGVALVTRGAARDELPERPGRGRRAVWAAMAAAVGFGLLIPAIDQVAPAAGALGAIVLVFAIDVAIAVSIAVMRGVAVRAPGREAWAVVGLAGLLEVAGFACANLGAAVAPLMVVAPAASVSAPVTALWAWVVLGERPGRLVGAGTVLSAVGVLLLAG